LKGGGSVGVGKALAHAFHRLSVPVLLPRLCLLLPHLRRRWRAGSLLREWWSGRDRCAIALLLLKAAGYLLLLLLWIATWLLLLEAARLLLLLREASWLCLPLLLESARLLLLLRETSWLCLLLLLESARLLLLLRETARLLLLLLEATGWLLLIPTWLLLVDRLLRSALVGLRHLYKTARRIPLLGVGLLLLLVASSLLILIRLILLRLGLVIDAPTLEALLHGLWRDGLIHNPARWWGLIDNPCLLLAVHLWGGLIHRSRRALINYSRGLINLWRPLVYHIGLPHIVMAIVVIVVTGIAMVVVMVV